MDFSEAIEALAERAQKLKPNIQTEEATKTALVLPFIKELGYDIFNPLEVIPEFTADIADFKGEKVDYAIMHEGEPIMLIECKCCGCCLDDVKQKQLHRYFLTLDASIGILTDGIQYLFFSKSDDGKNMDSVPFMEFSLDNIDPVLLPELRKLCKGKFDLQKTLDTVNELKFNRQIKKMFEDNLKEPQESFVTYFVRECGLRAGRGNIELFSGYLKRAMTEFVDERVDERLKTALAATSKKEEVNAPAPEEACECEEQEPKIETTSEELQGYLIVKAIMSKVVDPNRVAIRDTQSYCGVLLDDKNTKPICRMHFNAITVKYIETFDAEKKGTKHKIENLNDIYRYQDELRATAKYYDSAE